MELIVKRRPRRDEADRPAARQPGASDGASNRRVALRIGWREGDLQRRVKSAGGRWDPDRRVWFVRRDAAARLGLLDRGVGGGS